MRKARLTGGDTFREAYAAAVIQYDDLAVHLYLAIPLATKSISG